MSARRTVKALLCFDSFKDSLAARAACEAAAEGLRHGLGPLGLDVQPRLLPLSDGGEGFLNVLAAALPAAERRQCTALNSLGRPKPCEYLLVPSSSAATVAGATAAELGAGEPGALAVVEMAAVCGLEELRPEERDPLRTTTHGVGEVLLAAYAAGARRFVLGIGGSATNDAGLGCLHALGLQVTLDPVPGEPEPPRFITGADVLRVRELGLGAGFDPLPGAHVAVACDVRNPLTGPDGATRVYGPQKGATPDAVERLEAALGRVGALALRHTGVDLQRMEGSGAAGGLGGLLCAALPAGTARLRRGMDVLADAVGLEAAVLAADVVLTGEGSFDGQSLQGKVVSAVLALCRRHGRPLAIACGRADPGVAAAPPAGALVWPLTPRFAPEVSMRDAARCLSAVVADGCPALLAAVPPAT